MINLAMERKLRSGEALDVLKIGELAEEPGHYRLREFREGVDYCDASIEAWIWSIGRHPDGTIIASLTPDQYGVVGVECLWLR